jgi:O-antigen/teichoic acid export membrane protein
VSVGSRIFALGVFAALGQVLIVVTLPLFSHIYDPATYGSYVLFVGVFAVCSVFAGLRYESAIVLARANNVAVSLSAIVCMLGIVVALILAIITAFIPARIVGLSLSPSDVAHFGYALAVATVIGAIQRILTSWCTRRSEFMALGLGQLTFGIASIGVQLTVGLSSPGVAALVWGYNTGLAAQCALLWIFLARGSAANLSRFQSRRALQVAAKRYRRFPQYMVGYAFASSLRDRLVQVVVAVGAGASVVGRFGLSWRLVNAPNSLIYSAITPVFYSLACKKDRDTIATIAGGLVEILFLALVVPFVAIAFDANRIADSMLGAKWAGTGPYLMALAAPALLLAATCWLDRAFDAFGRQGVAFALEATFTVICVGVLAALSKILDGLQLIWLFAILATSYYWAYSFTAFRSCGLPMAPFTRAGRVGIGALAVAIIGALLVAPLSSLIVRLLAQGVIAIAMMAVWYVYLDGRSVSHQLLQSGST